MTASFLNQKTLCKPHGASVFSTPDINGQKSDEIAPHPADLCPDTHRYRRRIAAHLHTIVPAAALPLRKPPPWQAAATQCGNFPSEGIRIAQPAGICFNPAVNRMLQSSAPPHRKQFDRMMPSSQNAQLLKHQTILFGAIISRSQLQGKQAILFHASPCLVNIVHNIFSNF